MSFIICTVMVIVIWYSVCVYKKIKDGYEQRFKYMSKKQRIFFIINILVFIIGVCLMTFGLYKNISTTNYFKKNGVYAEGEIIAYRIAGQGISTGGLAGGHSTYTCKIQIENNGEQKHYYAWLNESKNYLRNSTKVNFYYLDEKYTENYVGVINAMIEGENYCELGYFSEAYGLIFIAVAPLIWFIRHNVE